MQELYHEFWAKGRILSSFLMNTNRPECDRTLPYTVFNSQLKEYIIGLRARWLKTHQKLGHRIDHLIKMYFKILDLSINKYRDIEFGQSTLFTNKSRLSLMQQTRTGSAPPVMAYCTLC